MKSKIDKPRPLSRDHWLGLALDTLAEQGRSKFSLDTLLKAMPSARAAFTTTFEIGKSSCMPW